MINNVLSSPEFPFNFNIENEKNKFILYGGNLSEFWINKTEISKNEVIKIINDNKLTNKDQLLAILFWGVYFSAVKKNPAIALIQFINSDNFDEKFEDLKNKIIYSDSPYNLFKDFETKSKIPGIGYAYFTKLFFFYRIANNKEVFLILDKWLSMAWCAIDGIQNNNTSIFNKFYKAKTDYFFDGLIKRNKAKAYSEYNIFMKELSKSTKINVVALEEKLFGVNLKDNQNNNPRNQYKKWAINNNIPLTKPKQNKSLKPELNKKEFYLKKTAQYIGLYTDFKCTKKEGYIDVNGWFCVSELLKDNFDNSKMTWILGNTKGGSKEKYKSKFINQIECLNIINKYIVIINIANFNM